MSIPINGNENDDDNEIFMFFVLTRVYVFRLLFYKTDSNFFPFTWR